MADAPPEPSEEYDLDHEAPSPDESSAVAELDDPELDDSDPELPSEEAFAVIETHGDLNDPEDGDAGA